MDVQDLERLETRLEAYLSRFDDCFGRCDTRAHLTTYVRGQLSDSRCQERRTDCSASRNSGENPSRVSGSTSLG